MSQISALCQALQLTAAEIARVERKLAADPAKKGLEISLLSLEKQLRKQEAEFRDMAARGGHDVCSYRLFSDAGRYTLTGTAESWAGFQKVVSTLYTSIRSGGKRTRADVETVQATTFDIAYAFAGSIGVVLTVPNEALMLAGTALDDSIETAFEIAHADKPEALAHHAARLGAAPLRALYKWADSHCQHGFGADIRWRRKASVRASLHMQPQEFTRLRHLLSIESEPVAVEFDVMGKLVGGDLKTQAFRLDVGGELGEITGTAADVFQPDKTYRLGDWYRGRVRETSTTRYASEENVVKYALLSLVRVQ